MDRSILAIHEDHPGEGIGKLIGTVALVGLAYIGILVLKNN